MAPASRISRLIRLFSTRPLPTRTHPSSVSPDQRTLHGSCGSSHGSNTWNDALSSATVACHQMVHRTADADDLSADCQRDDKYTRSDVVPMWQYQIRRIAVMVSHALYMVVDKLACKFSAVSAVFLRCVPSLVQRNLVTYPTPISSCRYFTRLRRSS